MAGCNHTDENPPQSGGWSQNGDASQSLVVGDLNGYMNVKDFGAKGDGQTDDAKAIQDAIDACYKNGGIVYIPAGMYRMKSGVLIKMGVQVIGELDPKTADPWKGLSAKDYNNPEALLKSDLFKGTWIICDHGYGDVNAAATFTFKGGYAGIQRIGFVHAGLAPLGKIEARPPAVALYNYHDQVDYEFGSDGVTVSDIYLANPYIGIAMASGSDLLNYKIGEPSLNHAFGRQIIRNIYGGALYKTVMIKDALDTVDMNEIHFQSTNENADYVKYRAENCTDMEFARADGMHLSAMTSRGADRGIGLVPAYEGYVSIRASELDIEANIPLYIGATGQYEIFHSRLAAVDAVAEVKKERYASVFIEPEKNIGIGVQMTLQDVDLQVKVSDKSAQTNALYTVISTDPNEYLQIDGCTFSGWNTSAQNANNAPLWLYKENNYGSGINLSNCVFNGGGAPLLVESGAKKTAGFVMLTQCTVSDRLSLPEQVWFNNCLQKKADGSTAALNRS